VIDGHLDPRAVGGGDHGIRFAQGLPNRLLHQYGAHAIGGDSLHHRGVRSGWDADADDVERLLLEHFAVVGVAPCHAPALAELLAPLRIDIGDGDDLGSGVRGVGAGVRIRKEKRERAELDLVLDRAGDTPGADHSDPVVRVTQYAQWLLRTFNRA
jgi:hypothetical protein